MGDTRDSGPKLTPLIGCEGSGRTGRRRANQDLLPELFLDTDGLAERARRMGEPRGTGARSRAAPARAVQRLRRSTRHRSEGRRVQDHHHRIERTGAPCGLPDRGDLHRNGGAGDQQGAHPAARGRNAGARCEPGAHRKPPPAGPGGTARDRRSLRRADRPRQHGAGGRARTRAADRAGDRTRDHRLRGAQTQRVDAAPAPGDRTRQRASPEGPPKTPAEYRAQAGGRTDSAIQRTQRRGPEALITIGNDQWRGAAKAKWRGETRPRPYLNRGTDDDDRVGRMAAYTVRSRRRADGDTDRVVAIRRQERRPAALEHVRRRGDGNHPARLQRNHRTVTAFGEDEPTEHAVGRRECRSDTAYGSARTAG